MLRSSTSFASKLPSRVCAHTDFRTYTSIDPAPPSSGLFAGQGAANDASPENVAKLRATLLDTSLSLFQRYRAMFALRNIGTPAAVDALAAGFADDSALFKHEIAFVFGQLLSTHSVPALLAVLQDSRESEMVRHEAAEALGGIATPEVLPHLKEYMAKPDAPRVVRESCQVAMDMWEVCHCVRSPRIPVLNFVLAVRELGSVPVCQWIGRERGHRAAGWCLMNLESRSTSMCNLMSQRGCTVVLIR